MEVLTCAANVSEGRRLDVVQPIAAAADRPPARLLDVHTDPDHNRSVLTVAGSPAALVDAILAAAAVAVETIDVGTHRGVHPRIGAVDVVPYAPLEPGAMPAAVAAARASAARLWAELSVPSFLYEDAAGGRPLPEVRRRAFRDLVPDFGGPGAHPTAGAAVVGAREILVAYNIDLATADVEVAKAIAAEIRESAGGLAHVRALGLALPSRGITQVSTNVLRPAVTPIGAVFEAVASRAASHGVRIEGSEIVGLAPRAALPPRATELALYRPPRVLEDAVAPLAGTGPE